MQLSGSMHLTWFSISISTYHTYRRQKRAAGLFFLGSVPEIGKPIQLNGNILVVSSILRFVVALAAEAELGGLFHNGKEAKILRLTLQELGHPQPPTPIHCDNKTVYWR